MKMLIRLMLQDISLEYYYNFIGNSNYLDYLESQILDKENY
jgi:hypothetical protein